VKTLYLPIESSSYSVIEGREIVQNRLDGGRSRFRRDILGAAKLVNAQWICDPDEFTYLKAFYSYSMAHASEGFLLSMVLDEGELTTNQCFFIPETFQLVAQQGLAYTCTAQLEVIGDEYNLEDDEALIDAWAASHS
jgi:hypothetical protein